MIKTLVFNFKVTGVMKRLLSVLLMCIAFYSNAQNKNQNSFYVTHVSAKIALEIPHVKDELNNAIVSLHTNEEVFKVLNKRLTGYVNEPVTVIETIGTNRYRQYQYLINAPKPAAVNIIDLNGARASLDNIYLKNDSETEAFLRGKIAIWDTLKVNAYATVNLREIRFSTYDSPVGLIDFRPSVVKKNLLVFDNTALNKYKIVGNEVNLFYNFADDKFNVRNKLTLYFLTSDNKRELSDFLDFLEKDQAGTPYANYANFTALLEAYSKARWGSLYDPDITLRATLLKN